MHVIFHAIVKALLFMVLGIVIHTTGKRSIDDFGGLGKVMPVTAICAGVGALTIAGTPPFCIFDSEWLIFSGGFETPYIVISIVALFGSLLTVAYSLWLVTRIFFGQPRSASVSYKHAHIPLAMIVPTIFLAILALVEGLLPAPIFNWVSRELALILGGQW
jgi:NADH:ubiquinone oxidoreductase subunit 5 (subunit L)/multisubunit Na+/H+ antiporter MnhA subunit